MIKIIEKANLKKENLTITNLDKTLFIRMMAILKKEFTIAANPINKTLTTKQAKETIKLYNELFEANINKIKI